MKKHYLILPLISLLLSSCTTLSATLKNSSLGESNVNTSNNDSTSSSIDEPEIYEGYYRLCSGVYVNYLPGLYSEDLVLDFKILNDNYQLYYSLDFNDRDPLNVFIEPIEINQLTQDHKSQYPLTTSVDGNSNLTTAQVKSDNYINNIQNTGEYPLMERHNVVRIKVVDEIENVDILNRSLTYIINEDVDSYSLPIVSLSMPYDQWFGPNGFYNQITSEIEKRVQMEYFDPISKENFYINSKIKLGGNYSKGYPQRTLNLNFKKDENGLKNTPISVNIFNNKNQSGFPDKPLKKLTRFRLHNGGNCFEQWTGFNDALLHNMMKYTNIGTSGCRPALGFLNGEYWGIYYIREHYSDVYFKDNYGVDDDNVILYEYKWDLTLDDGDPIAGEALFNEFMDYINAADFTDENTYNDFITNYIDIDSFIDFILANHFACNWDSVGNRNNMKMWRAIDYVEGEKYADGKWRFCLHDVDFAFTENKDYLNKSETHSYNNFILVKKLMKSETFKDRLYQRADELIGQNFNANYAIKILEDMADAVSPYKKDAGIRWGQNNSFYTNWLNEIDKTKEYLQNRSANYLASLQNTLKMY